jgi:curved DNA-binding protein
MEFKDYYSILGVEPNADETAIKTAYRRLARKYHPDVSDHADAEARFKEVAEAYQVLKDAAKRADYDQLRAHREAHRSGPFEPPPGWRPSSGFAYTEAGPQAGFSDFFEEIFGAARAQASAQREQYRHGQDLEMELPVFLEDLVGNAPQHLAYKVPCFDAQGLRLADEEKSLKVNLPPGIGDGELIRLKGQGGRGIGKGAEGDLFVRVRLVPHPLFDVEGHDLIVTVPVAPWEAALGAKVEVPTLTGSIKLKIPANSQGGTKLRIKGNGLPGKASSGDLYAMLKVVMPPTMNEEQKALWQSLSERAVFDPRSHWRK